MGPALPVLVAPTAALAAEAVCMLQATLPADQQGLTIDLGCAMLRLSAPNKPSRYADQVLPDAEDMSEASHAAIAVHPLTT